MDTSEIFKTRVSDNISEKTPEKPAEVTGSVEELPEVFDGKTTSLDDWELQNGKYGLEYLGIKEIGKTFPLNTQFSILDKYIKSEMDERGYDKTPARWQEILAELEDEIGTRKLDAYTRIKKLVSLIKIINKQKELKRRRELYR